MVWGFKKQAIRKVFIDVGSKAFFYGLLRYIIVIDPIILSFFINKNEIAIYSFYWLPASYVIIILSKIAENSQPFLIKSFAENDFLSLQSQFKRNSRNILLFAILGASSYFLLFPYFVSFWIGYNDVDIIPQILFSVFIVTSSIMRLYLSVLYSNANYRALIRLSLIELILKMLTVAVFISQLSFYLTITAHLTAHILVTIAYGYFLSSKEIKSCAGNFIGNS